MSTAAEEEEKRWTRGLFNEGMTYLRGEESTCEWKLRLKEEGCEIIGCTGCKYSCKKDHVRMI